MHTAYSKLIPFNMKYLNIFSSFRNFGRNYIPVAGKIRESVYCAGLIQSRNPAHPHFCRKAAGITQIPGPMPESSNPALNFREFRDALAGGTPGQALFSLKHHLFISNLPCYFTKMLKF